MERAMSNLLLSPRAHRLLSFLYAKEGNEEAAAMEFEIAETCIQGILATGEGSRENPFLVNLEFTKAIRNLFELHMLRSAPFRLLFCTFDSGGLFYC
jgi:leucyl aminopeptidase